MLVLQRKRILVTRTRRQASDLAAGLEALGAAPILIPTIEIVAPESYAPLDAALAELESFDWLIFTSANAVEVFEQRRSPSLRAKKIAVIGPATARAVQGIGLEVDLVPPRYVAESLAEALMPEVRGRRILLVRAAEARDVLPEALTAAGASVTIAEAYRNQTPPESVTALRRLFGSPAEYPDAITFTSASTARNLVALLEAAAIQLPGGVVLASIGPITSQALRELGYEPQIEAAEPTIPALVQAIAGYFGPSQ
jgi:uroporphyrinogen-III synthase